MLLCSSIIEKRLNECKRIEVLLKNAEKMNDTKSIDKYKKELKRVKLPLFIA